MTINIPTSVLIATFSTLSNLQLLIFRFCLYAMCMRLQFVKYNKNRDDIIRKIHLQFIAVWLL